MTFPIFLASLWGATIYFERLWLLKPVHVMPPSLQKQVKALVAAGKVQEALVLTESSETPYAKLMRQILEKSGRAYPYLRETAEDAGKEQVEFLERRMGSLNTVIAISPLMGLLGTVLGMITVFQAVADKGVGSPMDWRLGFGRRCSVQPLGCPWPLLRWWDTGIFQAVLTVLFRPWKKKR